MSDLTPAQLFGDKLVAAMGDMPLSVLARRTGLNRQQVHRYVNGQALPRADNFMKICEALGLDPWTAIDSENGVPRPRSARFDADLFGNAKNPSQDQFPSGIYEVFTANPTYLDSIARIIFVIENNGATCLIRSMIPKRAVPPGTPNAFRHMSGFLKVKFGQSYFMSLINQRVADSDEKTYVTVMIGAEEPALRLRLGISMRFLPYGGMEAFASKVAMRRLPDTSYRDALKRPTLFKAEDAPEFIKGYFMARSRYPYHFGPAMDDRLRE